MERQEVVGRVLIMEEAFVGEREVLVVIMVEVVVREREEEMVEVVGDM